MPMFVVLYYGGAQLHYYNGVILEAIREASFTNGALQIQRALNLAGLSNA